MYDPFQHLRVADQRTVAKTNGLGARFPEGREDLGNFVPCSRVDLVPQPAVQKRILIIFGHLCPHEVFEFANCYHVLGLQFVLDTGNLRSIRACPSCVLLVPLGQTQNGFHVVKGSPRYDTCEKTQVRPPGTPVDFYLKEKDTQRTPCGGSGRFHGLVVEDELLKL